MTLRLSNVAYRYAGTQRPALSGVELALEPGEVLGVMGANDSGKSTLALVASGLAPGTIGGELTGEVSIDGLISTTARPHELAQRCGVLFQNPLTQLSGTAATVFEEIAFGPRNLSLPLDDVVARVTWAMGVLGLESLGPRDPARLSGGQAQLVALAAVLALRPRYVVLDEPTSQLDPLGTAAVADALAGLAAHGDAAILVVEHKPDLLQRLAQRIVVLEQGHVALAGTAVDVLGDARLEELGVAVPSAVRLRRAAAAAGVTLGIAPVGVSSP